MALIITPADLPRSLRGNPLIGPWFVVLNPDDAAYGSRPVQRICDNCFFRRRGYRPKDADCMVAGAKPKKNFDIAPDDEMPELVDGWQVGYYCDCWCHYLTE